MLHATTLRDHVHGQLIFDFMVAPIALGRMDEAVERLERAIEARIGAVVLARLTFAWENLRPDPRMNEILAAVGLWWGPRSHGIRGGRTT